jgi:hypothetical protein
LVLLGNKEQQQLPLAFPPRVLRGVRLFLDTGVILFFGTDRGNPVKFGGVNPILAAYLPLGGNLAPSNEFRQI